MSQPNPVGLVTEQAPPEPQRSRSRSNCKCVGPCFYCGEPINGAHQHDHMPFPWRHGGRETVPSCSSCHNLKDRRRWLQAWPPASQRAAAEGMSASGTFLIAMFNESVADPFSEPFDLDITRDQALGVIQACTTCEARVFMARGICLILDEAKRLAGLLALDHEQTPGRTTATGVQTHEGDTS
jgi:hypothetical protein